MEPIKLLNSVTSSGPGASVQLEEPHDLYGFQASVTGATGTTVINVEGSLDGVNWWHGGNTYVPGHGADTVGFPGVTLTSGSPVQAYVTVAGVPALYLRANVTSYDGTATIDAWILPVHAVE